MVEGISLSSMSHMWGVPIFTPKQLKTLIPLVPGDWVYFANPGDYDKLAREHLA